MELQTHDIVFKALNLEKLTTYIEHYLLVLG